MEPGPARLREFVDAVTALVDAGGDEPRGLAGRREAMRRLGAADDWRDSERAVRLRAERSALIQQLAAAMGLGGRTRVAASASERARMSVGKAIRTTLQRIERQSPSLGRHLAISVHTGTFCSYVPDPGFAFTWRL